jgi:hypothetical protein
MKIITIVWLVLATLLVVLNHAGNYWLGYSETPTALAVTNRFFGLLMEIALFLLFVIPALWTELARKQRLWSYVGLLGFWPLVILTFYLVQTFAKPAGELIAQGLRDRVMRDVTLDELRHFAKEVNDAGFLKVEDLVNPLDISPLTSQQRDGFAKLGAKYPFMHWLDDGDQLRGPSLLNCGQDDVVEFEWAVKNRGHWGCSISIDGAKSETIPFPDAKILRVSDDIYFYYRA